MRKIRSEQHNIRRRQLARPDKWHISQLFRSVHALNS